MKSEYILGKIRHSREVIKLIYHLRLYDRSEVAKERRKIISFYDTYGEKAAKEAFGADRKLIYLWRKRIKARGGLNGLVPDSQAPKNPRRSKIDARIIGFIKEKREFVPRMSKKKLKPLLDEFCQKEDLSIISVATVGRVIKRNKFFFYKTGRAYLEREGVKHVFIYPHSPEVNGVVERFNRTLNEDFFEPNFHLIYDPKAYNQKPAEYMIYYNCQRQHESLNNMIPTDYLIQKGGMSNMLWTCTKI